jgi:hypothetical protein
VGGDRTGRPDDSSDSTGSTASARTAPARAGPAARGPRRDRRATARPDRGGRQRRLRDGLDGTVDRPRPRRRPARRHRRGGGGHARVCRPRCGGRAPGREHGAGGRQRPPQRRGGRLLDAAGPPRPGRRGCTGGRRRGGCDAGLAARPRRGGRAGLRRGPRRPGQRHRGGHHRHRRRRHAGRALRQHTGAGRRVDGRARRRERDRPRHRIDRWPDRLRPAGAVRRQRGHARADHRRASAVGHSADRAGRRAGRDRGRGHRHRRPAGGPLGVRAAGGQRAAHRGGSRPGRRDHRPACSVRAEPAVRRAARGRRRGGSRPRWYDGRRDGDGTGSTVEHPAADRTASRSGSGWRPSSRRSWGTPRAWSTLPSDWTRRIGRRCGSSASPTPTRWRPLARCTSWTSSCPWRPSAPSSIVSPRWSPRPPAPRSGRWCSVTSGWVICTSTWWASPRVGMRWSRMRSSPRWSRPVGRPPASTGWVCRSAAGSRGCGVSADITAMRALARALDPDGRLNPGVLLPPEDEGR